MGKGGEQSVSASNKNKKPLKLDHLETEVLRKWAKAYGLKDDKDRKVLLEELVRYLFPLYSGCFRCVHYKLTELLSNTAHRTLTLTELWTRIVRPTPLWPLLLLR